MLISLADGSVRILVEPNLGRDRLGLLAQANLNLLKYLYLLINKVIKIIYLFFKKITRGMPDHVKLIKFRNLLKTERLDNHCGYDGLARPGGHGGLANGPSELVCQMGGLTPVIKPKSLPKLVKISPGRQYRARVELKFGSGRLDELSLAHKPNFGLGTTSSSSLAWLVLSLARLGCHP